VRLIDNVTGKIVTHRGEAMVFPEPNETALDGDIRVVAGPNQVFLGPLEQVLDGGKQKAKIVDENHAVLVRDKGTGELRLITEKQLFIPSANESIEEVRELINLAQHEAMIIKDKDGNFHFHYGGGNDESHSFFLPPYAEIVRLCWSRGRRRETRDLYIDRFDCRAQYMSFEFNCRTKDNVELVLEGTFFWEVTDLPLMVRTTGNTSGDICNHARSQFIKHVAKVDLREFMDDLNTISSKVYSEDLSFYASRGVAVHSLEVTSYKCAEASTSKVLQQIIQETTNRMNRLSQQESENEVMIFKMQGQIEQEKLNTQLLEIQQEHRQKQAKSAGNAEAEQVAAFMAGLNTDVPNLSDRVSIWQTLRKKETLAAVAEGKAHLYYTPNDVDLSIGVTNPRVG